MAPRFFACFGKSASASKVVERIGTADVAAEEQRRGGAVLVELFSSQGCATSPEAELLVSRLGRGDFDEMGLPPVVVLAHHVDYWDYMGWKDPFGSSLSTVRQKAFVEALKLDTMFTPQVVVQGTAHCVGNDENALLGLIRNAVRYPAPSFQVRIAPFFF